jgi:hypothetical protein
MKFLNLSLVASLILRSTVAGSGSLQVVKDFLDECEIEHFLSAEIDDDPSNLASSVLGGACVSATIIERLHEAAGDEETCSLSGSAEDSAIVTTLVKFTTTRHADYFLNDDGSSYPEPTADDVGFIMLNNNPDAFFAYGDDGVQVAIKAGNLVTFPGNVEHDTVVKSGTVRLAGPFHVSSLAFVGNGCNTKADCSEGAKCDCNDNKRRALENILTLKGAKSCGERSGTCVEKSGKKKRKLLV